MGEFVGLAPKRNNGIYFFGLTSPVCNVIGRESLVFTSEEIVCLPRGINAQSTPMKAPKWEIPAKKAPAK